MPHLFLNFTSNNSDVFVLFSQNNPNYHFTHMEISSSSNVIEDILDVCYYYCCFNKPLTSHEKGVWGMQYRDPFQLFYFSASFSGLKDNYLCALL